LWVRSGLLYVQQNYNLSFGNAGGNINLSYFQVPVDVLVKFSDYGGVFVGAAADLNLSNSCSVPGYGSCSVQGVNSLPIALEFGGSFKFAPNLGAELYYQQITGNVVTALKNERAVALNFMITFD
jgi:hypothetical protein